MAESLLTLRNVAVRHGGKLALELARLDVERGEVLAVLGPNGAGKTTLLKVMGLLQIPDWGTVYFDGQAAGARNALAIRRRIASVFQEPLLLNTTVYQNAALGLKLRGWNRAAIGARLDPWLARLAIAPLAGRSARTLSGGEAQRTSLARAFAVEPDLLLLDEPFSALDPAAREALLADFQRIINETKTTTVFVTHDRDEAYLLADRVAILQDGRMLQIGLRDEVFLRPATAGVAETVGIENLVAGVVERSMEGRLEISVGGVRLWAEGRLKPGAAVVACIRAEEVRPSGIGRDSALTNRVTAKVAEVSPGLARQRLRLDCGSFFLVASIDRRAAAASNFSPGVQCTATIDPAAVHVVLT